MCFQVNIMLSHRLKGEMESSAKTRLPLHSIELLILRRHSALRLWYNLHSYVLLPKGRKLFQRALMIPFLAIYAKGGESMSPKQKDRTTTNFKNLVFSKEYLSIGILLCSKEGERSISKMIYQNPLEH